MFLGYSWLILLTKQQKTQICLRRYVFDNTLRGIVSSVFSLIKFIPPSFNADFNWQSSNHLAFNIVWGVKKLSCEDVMQ